jgi:hypothetical protein
MQFFKSTILLAVAFVTFTTAAPGGEPHKGDNGDNGSHGGHGGHGNQPQCKSLLQSCRLNSECCGELCLLGVSVPIYCGYSSTDGFYDIAVVRLRRILRRAAISDIKAYCSCVRPSSSVRLVLLMPLWSPSSGECVWPWHDNEGLIEQF